MNKTFRVWFIRVLAIILALLFVVTLFIQPIMFS